MKKADVELGAVYTLKVSGKLTKARVVAEASWGGWRAVNLRTGREIYVRSAQRLRERVA